MSTEKISFEEWLKTAPESELRKASEFIHHYPVEIRVIEVTMDDLRTKGKEILDHDNWPVSTVCGCEPAYRYDFGSEGHEPLHTEETLNMDELAEWLENQD